MNDKLSKSLTHIKNFISTINNWGSKKVMTKNQQRRKLIQRKIPIKKARILEIGALDCPTFGPQEVNVKFMDWFTTEENVALMEKTKHHNPKSVVPVNYPIKKTAFSEELDQKFDLIIANHVIEHIPDVIGWINELEKSLTPNGKIFLSIPDLNRTFDIIRPETDVVELMRCHHEKLEQPSFHQILRSIYYWRPIQESDTWSKDDLSPRLKAKRFPLSEAIRRAKKLHITGTSAHCSVFSHDTFSALWDELLEAGLINMHIESIYDVQPETNEFRLFLSLPPSS